MPTGCTRRKHVSMGTRLLAAPCRRNGQAYVYMHTMSINTYPDGEHDGEPGEHSITVGLRVDADVHVLVQTGVEVARKAVNGGVVGAGECHGGIPASSTTERRGWVTSETKAVHSSSTPWRAPTIRRSDAQALYGSWVRTVCCQSGSQCWDVQI